LILAKGLYGSPGPAAALYTITALLARYRQKIAMAVMCHGGKH